jgi:CBS domain-containing protein
MKLKELMTSEVVKLESQASIQEAAEKMRSFNLSAIPVYQGRQLSGVITDRDITIRATADGRDPKKTLVSECLSSELMYGFEDQDIEEVRTLTEQRQIRQMPVLNRARKLVGFVCFMDLHAAKAFATPAFSFPQPNSPLGWGND